MSKRKTPKYLYKYRVFSSQTIDSLICDKVYFADPSTFNDPLDTQPVIDGDIDVLKLKEILGTLIRERVTSELTAAANTIKYRGSRTLDRIGELGRRTSHRGPEHRIVALLLQTLIDWCKARGIAEVYLGTTAQFLAAHRFYEKNGFREINVGMLPSSFPVMTVDTKFYALAIGPTD